MYVLIYMINCKKKGNDTYGTWYVTPTLNIYIYIYIHCQNI